MSDDLYTTLGVQQDCSQEDLKKAYRKLQMKHHPDKGGDMEYSKKINAAYSTLGDSEKRRQYDMKKANPFVGGMGGLNNDFFKMFFNGGNMPFGPMNGMSNDPNIRIFHNGRMFNVNNAALRKPAPIIKHIDITIMQAYAGGSVPLEIERWCQEGDVRKVEREKIYIPIRAGVDNNEIIIVRNKGNVINDNLRGDVKIFIRIANNTHFKRNGLNLLYRKRITLKEALTGFSFDLKHLSGKIYVINNQDGKIITPSFKKIINHMGMRRERKHPAPPIIGDLIIDFTIEFPENLTENQIKQLKKIL